MRMTLEEIKREIAFRIELERERQDEKWGEQNHTHPEWMGILTEEVGEVANVVNHIAFGGHKEEADLAEELVQVAAVAVVWLEMLERHRWKTEPTEPIQPNNYQKYGRYPFNITESKIRIYSDHFEGKNGRKPVEILVSGGVSIVTDNPLVTHSDKPAPYECWIR